MKEYLELCSKLRQNIAKDVYSGVYSSQEELDKDLDLVCYLTSNTVNVAKILDCKSHSKQNLKPEL